ncbi:hypothetical protein SAMCCGM7_pB0216 (plasmid) [Sinorhizobium americanum CCGM7]|nr:hypothetical protein SAMCCGM7_pB0216 [Sinorhizobium americanum CCGM7]
MGFRSANDLLAFHLDATSDATGVRHHSKAGVSRHGLPAT